MIVVFLTSLYYTVSIGFISFIVYKLFIKKSDSSKCLESIPGPPKSRIPFIGNLDQFWKQNVPLNQAINKTFLQMAKLYPSEGMFKFHIGPQTIVVVYRQDTTEPILSSNSNIDKAYEYSLLKDWLGNGSLLSSGQTWKNRRRILTPAFHFKILEDFLPIINEQSNILLNVLNDAKHKEWVDISHIIILLSLDIICETSMGVSLGIQTNSNQEYVKALHKLGEIFMKRAFSPWLLSDFIFYKTSIGRENKSCLKILHTMTRNVINKRKAEMIAEKSDNKSLTDNDKNDASIYSTKRKRLAFLDLLLNYHIEDNSLSLEEIREEVDTIMFAGHDTTGMSLTWALFLIGHHPEVQNKIQEELRVIFGEDINRDITGEDIKQMNYLECVIKESLRLYAVVPLIGRKSNADLKLGNHVIPKGTGIYVHIQSLHLNPQEFPDPQDFKPERFDSLNTKGRNPYIYTPFSAGPRGCIGRRFAMNEEKIVLAKIFLNYNIRSLDQREDVITSGEMILRNKTPVRIQIIPKEE